MKNINGHRSFQFGVAPSPAYVINSQTAIEGIHKNVQITSKIRNYIFINKLSNKETCD